MMKIYDYIGLTTQEVPFALHTSICVAGCPNNCPNCSWNETKDKLQPFDLTDELFYRIMNSAKDLSEMVVFLGGEWVKDDLLHFAKIAKNVYKKQTCFYTGIETIEEVPIVLQCNFDYIKTGHYKEELGPLSSKTTNQKFYRMKDMKVLNFYFQEPPEKWKYFENEIISGGVHATT